jgi:hypothetical protein
VDFAHSEGEFIEDVDRIRGDRHQEDRAHGAHDVDGVAQSDQAAQAPDDADHCDTHVRQNHRAAAEHQPEGYAHDEPGNRRKERHLPEHLGSKGVAGHRIAGEVKLLTAGLLRKQGADLVRDRLAVRDGFNRNEDRRCGGISRNQAVDQERVAKQGLPKLEQCSFSLRNVADGGFDDEFAITCSHVVHACQAVHVTRDDPGNPLNGAGQRCDRRERVGIDHALRIDDAQHDDVRMQDKRPFDLVVVLPDGRGGRQHVLGIRVDGDLRKLRPKEQCDRDGQANDQPRMVSRKR